ncbi:glucose-6-phosphate isomerase [Iodidimonas sp. SYSU 1G8]|uniref:glucose-6-phosphate isomerase n=1 Tax=Iodidimonas sp. SYSU 1G8 TaxID=3133967 RepID=UPI0031FE8489
MIPLSQTLDACFESAVGSGGVSQAAFETAMKAASAGVARIRKAYRDGAWPLLRLPEDTTDLLSLTDIAGLLSRQSKHVVVLGIGGSSLGGQTLTALAPRGNLPVVEFADNLDPRALGELLTSIDFLATSFIVVSKSGGTPETLAQLLVVLDAYRARGLEEEVGARVLAIAQPGTSALRDIARQWSIPVLDHDPDLGGRFSVLSGVGLLPAALAGLDLWAIRAGAAAVLRDLLHSDNSSPAMGAAMAGALAAKGVTTLVMMPYVGRFERVGHWYRQLLSESVGKDGKGLTPLAALGPVDQHSMQQLLVDGPYDKLVTVITADIKGSGPTVPADLAQDKALSFMAGRTIGDVVDAQARASMDVLIRKGHPVRHIAVGEPDEKALGALLMHFMLETIIIGDMLGVDPFDQPAVELGKVLTREYLQNP